MKKINDWGLTILGIVGAIGNAVYNINWLEFDIKKEWPKLLASVALGVVGYFATIKSKKKDDAGSGKEA
jgi:uncharacterized membrane protein YjjB (DUF3815 family)